MADTFIDKKFGKNSRKQKEKKLISLNERKDNSVKSDFLDCI